MNRPTNNPRFRVFLQNLLRTKESDEDRIVTIITAIDGEVAVGIFMTTGEKPMSTDPRLGVNLDEIIEFSKLDRQRVLEILQHLREDRGSVLQLPNGKYAQV